jgi:hypothetical protein
MVACSQSLPRKQPTYIHYSSNHPCREEKTEQLVDTRHEVDQLVLELQKVKQEVSLTWACVSRILITGPRKSGTQPAKPLQSQSSREFLWE